MASPESVDLSRRVVDGNFGRQPDESIRAVSSSHAEKPGPEPGGDYDFIWSERVLHLRGDIRPEGLAVGHALLSLGPDDPVGPVLQQLLSTRYRFGIDLARMDLRLQRLEGLSSFKDPGSQVGRPSGVPLVEGAG